jgi:DNA-binding XRE family transcriptional regulator
MRAAAVTRTGTGFRFVPMSSPDLEAAFNAAFRARVRAARKAQGMTQADMARLLGISRASYARYETRTLLPLHLVEEFVEITGADPEDCSAPRTAIGGRPSHQQVA